MANVEKQLTKMELDFSQVTRTRSILNQNQVQKLWNSTPSKFQYKRPAKGGGQWDYVKASYVRKVLDSVFGFDWDFEIETTLAEAFEVAKMTNAVVVKGTLTARVQDGGRTVELKKTQFGRSEVKWLTQEKKDVNGQTIKINGKPVKEKKLDDFTGAPVPLDFGNDMKAAVSDALKKCASLFGIAADIYEKEEFVEITLSGSETEKEKQAQKKIKKAQKTLAEQSTKVGGENEQSA
jgi:hypothetical protein